MKKSSRLHTLMLLISVIILIVSAGLYAYLYFETTVLVNRAATAKGVAIAEEADLLQGKDLLSLYQSTADKRALLSTFFVPADDAVAFIQTIESLGSSSGAAVSISSINDDLDAGAVPGTVGTITAHLDAQGSWASVMKTIALFESLPYQSAINHVTLNTSTLTTDKGIAIGHQWSLSFDIASSALKPLPASARISISTTTQP